MENDIVTYEVDDVGIIPVESHSELDSVENFDDLVLERLFADGVTPTSAKYAAGMLKSLEEQIKAADRWGEYASKFCVLEFQMWIKIAEVEGSEEKLNATQKDTVAWIRSKSKEELDELLEICREGRKIRTIILEERRANRSEIVEHNKDAEYKRISDKIVDNLDKFGFTTLTPSSFIENWRNTFAAPDSKTVKAYIESTRDRLLKKNAYGLGDSGTYMLIKKCSDKNIASIVETRIKSILADLHSLAEICQQTDFYVDDDDLSIIHAAVDGLGGER